MKSISGILGAFNVKQTHVQCNALNPGKNPHLAPPKELIYH